MRRSGDCTGRRPERTEASDGGRPKVMKLVGDGETELPFELRLEGREGTTLLVKVSILAGETSVKAPGWGAA